MVLYNNVFLFVINHIYTSILYSEYKINNKNKNPCPYGLGKTKYLIIQGDTYEKI